MIKEVRYVTWIMSWVSDSETWYNPENTKGAKIKINNKWEAINWNNDLHIESLLNDIKNAGIDIIVSDLTNSFIGHTQSLKIQKKCMEKGLEFAVAFNHHGIIEEFEDGVQKIIDSFCGENAPSASCYAHKDGKPLIVTYVTREWFNIIKKSDSKFLDMFSIEWASGEDSDLNKWGWQLEPFMGPLSSDDSMFITSSIKWGIDKAWRKSLPWLDYCFYRANSNNARYRVVGGFDDMWERNCWCIANTTNSEESGLKMQSIAGRISTNAYYDRVTEWISGRLEKVDGGIVSDGVYRIACKDGKNRLTVPDFNAEEGAEVKTEHAYAGLNYNFSLYHLGGEVYKIAKLNTGLFLEDNGEIITQESNKDDDRQKFIIEKNNTTYSFKNKLTNNYIGIVNKSAISLSKFSDDCIFDLECVIDYFAD